MEKEMNNYKNIFSQNLKRIMSEKGVTQMDIMNALNIPSATISTWVNGQRMPKMSKIQMLAEYFNCDPMDFLVDESEDKEIMITSDEKQLLDLYRRLDAYSKHLIKLIANHELNRKENNNA